LKVIEIQQQHGAQPALAGDPRVRLREPVLKECPVGEPGERVVQRLVRELISKRALFGDVPLRTDKIENFTVGVSRCGLQGTNDNYLPILAYVAFDKAHLFNRTPDQTQLRISNNFHIFGMSEM